MGINATCIYETNKRATMSNSHICVTIGHCELFGFLKSSGFVFNITV